MSNKGLKLEQIDPDDESFKNVARDYPEASDADKYRLAQADTVLRRYRRQLSRLLRQDDGTVNIKEASEALEHEERLRRCIEDSEAECQEILQILRDGQGELLTDDQLEIVETLDVGELVPIDPRILKAEEYDGTTWAGLAELIRKRKAAKPVVTFTK
jgi:hypothetical protein